MFFKKNSNYAKYISGFITVKRKQYLSRTKGFMIPEQTNHKVKKKLRPLLSAIRIVKINLKNCGKVTIRTVLPLTHCK